MHVHASGAQIPYMGSKRALAPLIGEIIASSNSPRGACLDLFAGMCSVAGSLSRVGQTVWSNDVQKYSTLVADCMTKSLTPPPSSLRAADVLQRRFACNLSRLYARFSIALKEERVALGASDYSQLLELQLNWKHAGNCNKIAEEIRNVRSHRSGEHLYRLATLTFAHGYFGLRQAMEIDSIRYAVDTAYCSSLIGPFDYKWFILALLQAASHLSASPGHFAEFFAPHNNNIFSRILRLRRRSVWSQFLVELDRLLPFGSVSWRTRNKVFSTEATYLLRELAREQKRPSVIYADPPYSRAQYSRYYHVLETLVQYDYPDSTGAGRYRANRFQTSFSNARTVRESFDQLLRFARDLGATIIISYPSNGLLFRTGYDLRPIFERSFHDVGILVSTRSHSTLGGSPGREKSPVRELIYIGRRPK